MNRSKRSEQKHGGGEAGEKRAPGLSELGLGESTIYTSASLAAAANTSPGRGEKKKKTTESDLLQNVDDPHGSPGGEKPRFPVRET